MAGVKNPTVAHYTIPKNFDGTQIAIPADFLIGFELRVATKPDMSDARVFQDTSIEAGQQTTPIPQIFPPGQYYADVAGIAAGNVVQTPGPVMPFEVELKAEAPGNFSLA